MLVGVWVSFTVDVLVYFLCADDVARAFSLTAAAEGRGQDVLGGGQGETRSCAQTKRQIHIPHGNQRGFL